jgi:hypothetical protein
MRRMPGPIESRCRLSSSPPAARPHAARPQAARPQAARPQAARPQAARPQAARERRRKPASTITSKFEFRIMANLSRARSSYPIIRTRCPLLRLDPVGPPAAIAFSPSGERDRADLRSYVRMIVLHLLHPFVGENPRSRRTSSALLVWTGTTRRTLLAHRTEPGDKAPRQGRELLAADHLGG